MENGTRRHDEDGVFKIIQLCHHETEKCIDTVMSYSELSSSTVDFALVRPLTTLLAKTRHPGLLYALLVVRQNWLNQAEEKLAFQGVNTTRATLCEMLATKCLSLYPPRSHALARALTSYHNPFSGANRTMFEGDAKPTEEELKDLLAEGDRFGNSALELSIETQAKRFTRCAPVQQFIDDLFNGEVIYRPSSQHSLISDDYKSEAVVEPYNFAKTGLLDHYVLRIPRIRRLLDFGTILMLVFLFVTVQRVRDISRIEVAEAIFIIYGFGFAMEEAASIKERGFDTYTSQLWNMLDLAFLGTFFIYFALRVVGLTQHSTNLSVLSFDILAIGACFLFPRVCGILLTDSVVMIGLRAMLADYTAFLFLAVLCSFGFYLAFAILGKGVISAGDLAWMMVKVFLGSSYLGFEIAPLLHPHIGPALMLVYAIFSNTLLVTILISILSNTFANVTTNVVEEALFQKAVTTLDMVKGDALSEHCVPMNLVALPILLPAKFFLSSRHFHRLNVLIIRATHFPILLVIHGYYRYIRHPRNGKVRLHDRDSSDILQSWSGLRRTAVSDKLFERPVNKAGRTVEHRKSRESVRSEGRDLPSHGNRTASPVKIKGSGGQEALALQREDSASSSETTQPTGILAQLFGNTLNSRSLTQDSQTATITEDKYAALEAKLDKIEGMVSRLVTGGLSLENNDR